MTAMNLSVDIDSIKGFLDPAEGQRLYETVERVSHLGPCLEVGSYCGKSTVYLGCAVKPAGGQVYAVDHHRGSEEHQLGEQYHDTQLYDHGCERMDSLPAFRNTLSKAQLEEVVIPMIASSGQLGRYWRTPLALVFIDGGHSRQAALTDYRTWVPHILPGGYLLIHDIFPDPANGGQAPYEIFQLALASGLFEDCGMTKTLGVLQRISPDGK